MLNYVVEGDDLFDGVAERTLGQLLQVKEKHPDFRITLFTIPDRTSDATIKMYKEHDWIALAAHGWRHSRGECLGWTYHEAARKIELAQEKGIDAPAFRAPAWLASRGCYEVCRDRDMTLCDHKDNYLHVMGTSVYAYNDPARRMPKIRSIHCHVTQCAVDNYLGDMLTDGRMTFATKAKFLWPWEAAVVLDSHEKGEEA